MFNKLASRFQSKAFIIVISIGIILAIGVMLFGCDNINQSRKASAIPTLIDDLSTDNVSTNE